MRIIVLAAPRICRLSAVCQVWFHFDPKYFQVRSTKCCTSFGNPGIDFIINVHNSSQCASKIGELVYYLQSLTFHYDGRLLVRLSRCWLIYHLGLFDADCEITAVTWIRYLIHTFLHLLFSWSTFCHVISKEELILHLCLHLGFSLQPSFVKRLPIKALHSILESICEHGRKHQAEEC